MGLTSSLRRHPVASFFVLAFTFSWAVWLALLLVPAGNGAAVFLGTVIGAFGPAAAAIVLAGVLHPERATASSLRPWIVWLVLTALITPFAIWWSFLAAYPRDAVLVALSVVLAGLSALVIASAWSSRRGVKELMHSLVEWRVHPVWYLIALLAWPTLMIGSGLLSLLAAGESLDNYLAGLGAITVQSLVVVFTTTLLIAAPLQEEPGWRGFALPRLQARFNPIVASAILGFLWQLWHVPLYLVGLYPFDAGDIAYRLIDFLPGAIVFTWLYNRSKGSLLIAVVFHASLDASPQFLPAGGPWAAKLLDVLVLVWAIVVVVTDRMWRRDRSVAVTDAESPPATPASASLGG